MSLEIPHDYLDRILRDQWERAPDALLRLALGDPGVRVTGSLDSQPVLVRRGVDGIALAEDEHGAFVGHVEYETSADAQELGQRVSMYGALLYARTGLPVRSAVLLLEPCDALREVFEVRHGPALLSQYRFRVLRLHRIPAEALASSFELAVLSPLGADPTLEALRRARDTIVARAPGPERGDLLTALYIVGGRRFDHGTLVRVLSEEQLMQSATYQHIVEQGYNRGFARGEAFGLERGIEKGITTGRVQASRALTARMLRARFPEAGLEELAARCPDDQLEALADQILLCPDADALRRWLQATAG